MLNLLIPDDGAPAGKSDSAAGQETKGEDKGLYYYLLSLNAERTQVRDEAIEKLIFEGGAR